MCTPESLTSTCCPAITFYDNFSIESGKYKFLYNYTGEIIKYPNTNQDIIFDYNKEKGIISLYDSNQVLELSYNNIPYLKNDDKSITFWILTNDGKILSKCNNLYIDFDIINRFMIAIVGSYEMTWTFLKL